jgi:fatty-acid desaturase
LFRIAFLHHITWSINSICHTFGKEEFEVRDKSRNVSWLAILSFGESWHKMRQADRRHPQARLHDQAAEGGITESRYWNQFASLEVLV